MDASCVVIHNCGYLSYKHWAKWVACRHAAQPRVGVFTIPEQAHPTLKRRESMPPIKHQQREIDYSRIGAIRYFSNKR